ncbi:MAG: putative zinc-type alcohol dehydrogenase-like protein YjmD [Lentisphaerae bacterium ADurb.Bin242]|nr:MAG: putative zinc-type alcohol dehydrogenase-like protein YjmD [Lentisphaerae bacterium ADurb.Bin242]
MKSALYEGARKIVWRDVEKPLPGKGEAVIEVRYCGICGTDLHIYHGDMDARLHIPQTVGHEMSGVIDSVGTDVSDWKKGDRVTVRPLESCGECATCRRGFTHICEKIRFLGIETDGAFAQYWKVPAKRLHRLPEGMNWRLGALIEPLAVACHDVRRGEVCRGDFAVVSGGGPIGMLVALCARQNGARVVISEINAFRRAFAEKLGFETIDPLHCELEKEVKLKNSGNGADVVFEVSGSAPGALAMTALARPRGRIVMVAIYPKPTPVDLHKFFWKELTLLGARVYEREDFEKAIALAASGTLPLEKMITKVFPLEKLGEAFQYMEQEKSAMKILIQCNGGEK